MKVPNIIYWVSTAFMCLIFLFSAYNYFFNYEMIVGFFEGFGFPVWLIYPLAVAKILGVIAILSNASSFLKEWAYAGFFFNSVLALSAHLMAQDGGYLFSGAALLFLIISRIYSNRIFR